ncbi:MAG: hypothetical protein AVDCRST_MAG18-3632, partial [uncultured Thermomicrobiales bacterium]
AACRPHNAGGPDRVERPSARVSSDRGAAPSHLRDPNIAM